MIFEGIFGFYIDRNFLSNLYLLLMPFSLVFKLCKYLHFGSVKIHKYCYLGRLFVLTYIERLFSTVCCFFSYISWSVNCKSWVSKFHHFFLGCLETKARFIFQGFKYCPLSKVHFQLCSTFLAFFIWSVNCSRDFFRYFFSQLSHWIM